MYEVFLNERKIVIMQARNIPFVKEAALVENLNSIEEVKIWFLNFLESDMRLVFIIHGSTNEFWENLFLPVFTQIPAAGGVVIRNDKLLFIKRNDKWDLPKGKIDRGETAQDAACREVTEECGINGHQITKTLHSTYHIFKSPYIETFGQWILKETFWFEMSYPGLENGTPQTEENISDLRWFARNELDEVLKNTYENLKSLVMLYL